MRLPQTSGARFAGCRLVWLVFVVGAAGCDELEVDPAPPPSSREIAITPPGALGARPAGTSIEPPSLPAQPPVSGSEQEGPLFVPEPQPTGSVAPAPAPVPL